MRTTLRLATSSLIAAIATVPTVALAAMYDSTGAIVEEKELTAYAKLTAWVSPMDMAAIAIAFVLPRMPMSVFAPFALAVLLGGYKFALCFCLAYYMLQWAMGGRNAYD
jgi:hypothetical protein